MTWGWSARGALPADASGTGTTSGGGVGTMDEAKQTKAWPRYEAEYLKRALTSERYKYDTEGLDDQQKGVYLDRVVANYKAEADECLKAEFEQWLQGTHDVNCAEEQYENTDGKPVRRWVFRSPESTDNEGGYKVGQARAGWKHTPWGRTALTHLPGVREYLHELKTDAHDKDTQMQLLAEFGPQNVEQAWAYFKHWVKGRPLSDAVALPNDREIAHRSDYGRAMPERMYAYDSEPNDRQPGVLATDHNANNAAVALPGDAPATTTTDSEDRRYEDARALRLRMETFADAPVEQFREREQRAEVADTRADRDRATEAKVEEQTQRLSQLDVTQ